MAEALTRRQILRFWAPLAGTWAIMGAEVPIAAMAIGRLPDAATQLAALGAAMSIAWLSESLIVNLTTTSLRLGQDAESYRRTRRFAFTLIIGSGPAGYTAGVYASRAMLEPILSRGSNLAGN